MAGINFDTANTGGGAYGFNGTNIMDLAALGLVFGDGFNYRGRDYNNGGCCPPATCKDVNDTDRDVLQCAYDTQRDIWNTDRDVLLTGRNIKEDICDSTHKLEKDVWDVDKDVLIGTKETDHKIDMLQCKMGEGFAEVKGLIKETSLESELREERRENCKLNRKNEELHDKVMKQQIVAEILAAVGATPVIAASSARL